HVDCGRVLAGRGSAVGIEAGHAGKALVTGGAMTGGEARPAGAAPGVAERQVPDFGQRIPLRSPQTAWTGRPPPSTPHGGENPSATPSGPSMSLLVVQVDVGHDPLVVVFHLAQLPPTALPLPTCGFVGASRAPAP